MTRAWAWIATGWLVLLPCLWWSGRSQDAAQTLAWYLGTVALLAVTLGARPRRTLIPCPWIAAGLLGLLGSALWHGDGATLPLIILMGMTAAIGWWCLVVGAPSGAWLTRRVAWLAGINAAYWLIQRMGYDPLFVVDAPCGLFSHPSQLAMLLLAAVPLSPGWAQVGLAGILAAMGSWWALAALVAMQGWWTRGSVGGGWLCALLSLAGVVFVVKHPALLHAKLLPRLLIWNAMIRQIVWSPLVGYGYQAWRAMTPYPRDPWGYNAFLDAMHTGGVVLTLPVVWVMWETWRSRPSPARTAILLLAWMGLTHDALTTPRLLMLTTALLAAWWIGRIDETDDA